MKIKQKTHFSIRNKILVLLFAVAIPCMGLAIYLLISMHNYSEVYGKVVSEMTVANNYNITFKEKMDESMYKMVVSSVNSNAVEEDTAWEDPVAVPAVLCKNHGPFAWGKDAHEAVHNAVVLEEVAKMAYRAETINPEIKPAPQELQDKHYFRKHGANAYYGQSN